MDVSHTHWLQWKGWDAKEGEEISFGKEEPDNQRSTSSEQLTNQALPSEGIKEQHCLSGLDKNGKPQEHSVYVPQAKRSGAGPSAGEEGQGTNEKARRWLTQEVSEVSTDETEVEPNLSKTVIGSDLPSKGNCMNSISCQEGNLLKQASGGVMDEICSAIYEDGLEKNAHPEMNPSGEDYAKNLSQLTVKTEVDGGGNQELSAQRQVEEIQSADLKKQIVLAKESDGLTCLVDKERSESPAKEVPDRTSESAQEGTKMRSKKQDLPQPCNPEAQD
ncbi:hypothetical protein JD844_021230 [Phrynosoma platyrhinos]|uniref:Uncharacterized protein n=1 Tax=Phrynosoma platyrhinos TaxID=52577 RepID=A0ABQ7STA2_PHRPL|nr:hypothetical protein JD844_021230 [Phrynosoma platyrhinos]